MRISGRIGLVCLTLLGAPAAGCRTMIPANDFEPPRVELRIAGVDVGAMSNPPHEEWIGEDGSAYLDLDAGREYRFTLTVRDAGGVAQAKLQFPDNALDLISVDSAVPPTEELSDPFRIVTIRGDGSRPRNNLTLTGRFRTAATGVSTFDLFAEGEDFGGRSARVNRTFLVIKSAIDAPKRD